MFTFDMSMHAGMWHEILKVKLLKLSVILKIINHKKNIMKIYLFFSLKSQNLQNMFQVLLNNPINKKQNPHPPPP